MVYIDDLNLVDLFKLDFNTDLLVAGQAGLSWTGSTRRTATSRWAPESGCKPRSTSRVCQTSTESPRHAECLERSVSSPHLRSRRFLTPSIVRVAKSVGTFPCVVGRMARRRYPGDQVRFSFAAMPSTNTELGHPPVATLTIE